MKRREIPASTENDTETRLSEAEIDAISLRLRQMGDAGLRAAALIERDKEQV